MSNDVSRLWVIPLTASACLFLEASLAAQTTDELPSPQEPWLAEEGDWAADFNEAQLACYQGSMRACDSIWLSERVLLDSFLSEYGRSCGGRVDLREIRRANLNCTEAFPGHD
ncbi:MAG: hypothetical protein ACOZAM_23205 [Pseudomonadota bacterium]